MSITVSGVKVKRFFGLIKSLITPELLRFGVAGVVNTAVDWGTYFLFTRVLGVKSELLSKIAGVGVGMLVAYAQNSLFVFREQFREGIGKRGSLWKRVEYVLFGFFKMVATYSIGMTLNVVAFKGLRMVHFPELFALAGATGVSLSFNFIFTRWLVFKH